MQEGHSNQTTVRAEWTAVWCLEADRCPITTDPTPSCKNSAFVSTASRPATLTSSKSFTTRCFLRACQSMVELLAAFAGLP